MEQLMSESKPPVPLFDLTRQYQEVRADVAAAIERVFATQQFILGPEVAALEKECAADLKVKRAVAVSSGTDALLAALMAIGVGPGDEVITTPFTFFATAGVIHRVGARPVFVDIEERDFNIFFPTKNLGAFGDGGLITTNDEALGERLVDMRVHGMRPKYVHHFVGGNFRLDAIQAAILRAKLPRLDGWIARRREGAAHYRKLFTDAGLSGEVGVPAEIPGRGHTYHQYVVRAPRRDAVREFLAKRGIGSEVYYPISLHEQTCFAGLGHRRGDFPESERATAEVLALPIFPELRADERERVVEGIAAFFRG
jgi:dTDP-4-amino-4,6-dideoxygalactose transaminase